MNDVIIPKTPPADTRFWKRAKSEPARPAKTPETMIAVFDLGASSVNIVVRAWVNTEDFWSVYFALNEKIYKNLQSEGITFPFPQIDVNLKNK